MGSFKDFMKIQIANIIFSFASVVTKFVSVVWQEQGMLNLKFVSGVALYVMLLGIYAVFWQKIMKTTDLSAAYLCKGMVIFWSLLWAYLLLNENITVMNLIGTILIFIGTTVVMRNE